MFSTLESVSEAYLTPTRYIKKNVTSIFSENGSKLVQKSNISFNFTLSQKQGIATSLLFQFSFFFVMAFNGCLNSRTQFEECFSFCKLFGSHSSRAKKVDEANSDQHAKSQNA